ncbi:MAG: D-alanyl-D-alanine carboxypeptidase [Plectolyngbya sp. WJT66-NPBG17]|jgi:D-alanyl-D-alanine carboxypeptidase/D-alanyl-D-alanine-endopeptidase (penicillin-binding protein 4)|nr:D-alanyl-D-alanine carboxypeptidase [Plectolyngbya sp. WJT66-NPBG17]MBW4524185.1 D-alanyl-D-alanine carboxypeptidase [Phormidium tanganyikae FI6-MK23]
MRYSASVLFVSFFLIVGCGNPEAAKAPIAESPKSEAASRSVVIPPAFPTAPLALAPTTPDPNTNAVVQQYLSKLASQGYPQSAQGIWIQSGNTLLAKHQGTTPLSAASLTKVATSLAALQTYGVDHRYQTIIGTTGTLENGVVKGDLIVQGGDDPFFVWEEAIVLGNALSQQGIKQVTGDLIVTGRFFMNFETDLGKAGTLLKQGLNAKTWSSEAIEQYQTLSAGTPKPQIAIAGSVKVAAKPPNFTTITRHQSLPLAELLKKMNRYSNNAMAEIIASSIGGAKVVSLKAAQAAGVPQTEVILVNGSGLAVENRISPRAVCSMFLAIEQFLKPAKMTIGDIFAIVGTDEGILEGRKLPTGLVTKSGSLNEVSALAGALPTSQNGIVWFVVMNGGGANLEGFRAGQEALVNTFANQWGRVPTAPAELASNRDRANLKSVIEKAN